MIQWKEIKQIQDVEDIKSASFDKPALIYKHSTRCSLCDIAKLRLEDAPDSLLSRLDFYILDLLSYRSVSNYIAETFHVQHESPQILIIQNGECTMEESHLAIRLEDIVEFLKEPTKFIP